MFNQRLAVGGNRKYKIHDGTSQPQNKLACGLTLSVPLRDATHCCQLDSPSQQYSRNPAERRAPSVTWVMIPPFSTLIRSEGSRSSCHSATWLSLVSIWSGSSPSRSGIIFAVRSGSHLNNSATVQRGESMTWMTQGTRRGRRSWLVLGKVRRRRRSIG